MFGKKRRVPRGYWTVHRLTRETLRLVRIELQGVGGLDFFDRKQCSMIDLLQEVDMESLSFRVSHSGVDLEPASVFNHIDLPWTAQKRLGRNYFAG